MMKFKTKRRVKTLSCIKILISLQRKEGNILFNDALNTFYLRLSLQRITKKQNSLPKNTKKPNIPSPPQIFFFKIPQIPKNPGILDKFWRTVDATISWVFLLSQLPSTRLPIMLQCAQTDLEVEFALTAVVVDLDVECVVEVSP